MNRDERLVRTRDLAAVPPPVDPIPAPIDVLIVGGMGPLTPAGIALVLWEKEDAIRARLPELEQIVGAGSVPGPDSPPSPPTPVAPVAVDPPRVAVPPELPRDVDPTNESTPALRLEWLHQWATRLRDSDPDVAAIESADLTRLAHARINGVGDIVSFAGNLDAADQITRLAERLARVLAGEQDLIDDAGSGTSPQPYLAPAIVPDEVAQPGSWLPSPGRFAPFDWTRFGAESTGGGAAPLLVEWHDSGVHLSWSAPDDLGASVIYRVVESPDTWPTTAPDPDICGQVGATKSTTVVAELSRASAVTYVAVWANTGADDTSARMAQPRLVARGEIVWPPTDLSVSVTPRGEVAGTFIPPPGDHRIEVQRHVHVKSIRYDTSKALAATDLLPTGFIDRTPPAGVPLTYAAFAVVTLQDGNTRVSDPVSAPVTARAEPISIPLQVEPSATHPGSYDISWTKPPYGQVEIYLTQEKPDAGLAQHDRLSKERISLAGLTPERRVNHPAGAIEERQVIAGYALERWWVRGYFTAVHVISPDTVRVGPSLGLVVPKPPAHPLLIERVDSQIVTFEWPEGVKSVEAYQGPRGQADIDPTSSQVIASLTEDEYRRLGGMRITRALPSNGCSLHLFGVLYENGRPRRSTGTVLTYPGMTRIRYTLRPVWREGEARTPSTPPYAFKVVVSSDETVHATPLILVQHPTHLPLFPEQPGARHLRDTVVSLSPNVDTVLGELPVGPHVGFVRLFVARPPAECGNIAVLDPAVALLKVGLA